jgi:PAS domain S-box-containing protein
VEDTEGRVTFLNPAGERMLGYSMGELLGKNFHDICHYQRRDGTPLPKSECALVQAAFSGKTLLGHEDAYIRKDGTPIDVSCSSACMYEGDRIVGSVLVVHDITSRKLAEQEYRSLQEQFLQAQKMEAVGRLAGGIAHDFNNLLQIINGYASLIAAVGGSDPQLLAARAQAINDAGQRAAQLTRQLLDFSRTDPGVPEVIRLDSAMEELMKMVRTLVGADIDLTTRIQTDGQSVQISAGQLQQVVMNLVVNARDAMPTGGKLHIEASCVNLNDESRRALGCISAGPYVQVSVSDTGCGMDAETKRHVFEPFFTTKERGKGTGLGLSTVYGIVTQNGGGIRIDTALGVGSTFSICLPVAERKVVVLDPQNDLAPQRGTERVLLVEDQQDVTLLVAGQLASLGYNVVAASDGAEAFRLATASPRAFDLLITDMIMPKMGGQDLAEKIRRICPAIKVVQMSGYNDTAQPPFVGERPNLLYLQKPFTLKALAAVVRRALDQKPC